MKSKTGYFVIDDAPIQKWSNKIPRLWCDVCAVIKYCLEFQELNEGELPAANDEGIMKLFGLYTKNSESEAYLNNYGVNKEVAPAGFAYVVKKTGNLKKSMKNPYFSIGSQSDRHLRIGLIRSDNSFARQNGKPIFPRIVTLTIKALENAQQVKVEGNNKVIPSPLNIIYSLFTHPDNPCTAAIALTVCRNWLSNLLNVWPALDTSSSADLGDNILLSPFTEIDFHSSFHSFQQHTKIGSRWPDPRYAKKEHHFVANFLGAKGITHLYFSSGKNEKISKFLDFSSIKSFDDNNELEKKIKKDMLFSSCKLSSRYLSTPAIEEISNQLFGFPLPIKGLDVVFNGGMRPSSSGGLVISISGKAGTGKTSLALALSNSLRAFGTRSFFLSFEETCSDIYHKFKAIKPEYERFLSVTANTEDFFECNHLKDKIDLKDFSKIIHDITSSMKTEMIQKAGTCPGIIIIDNINGIDAVTEAKSKRSSISVVEKIISDCRSVNAITILVSADDLPSKYRIDYLSDIVMKMSYKNLGDVNDRPVRILNLLKCRHQLARQGSHIFHLGSGKGLRVVPHMDSLMNRREILKRELPDKNKIIHALNFVVNNKKAKPIQGEQDGRPYLELYQRSNILIHGYGSGGKAGFALKLLMVPPLDVKQNIDKVIKDNLNNKDSKYSSLKFRRRVLIISFLYPINYYEELVDKIHSNIAEHLCAGLHEPIVDDIVLYPGFIGPQDFLNKIISKIDQAKLEGVPYTGILIDGMHNIFLQYEKLQESNMVWAMLYNILSRYGLTVVSTFTNFSLSDSIGMESSKQEQQGNSVPDQLLMQQGMTPFLHALVKATDFYLYVREVKSTNDERKHIVSVRAAIGQNLPEKFLSWNRNNIEIEECLTSHELDYWIDRGNKGIS